MAILREVPVYWKCLSCGREGEYVSLDLDADASSFGATIRRVQVGECSYCTDGIEGPLPDLPGIPLDAILKAIIEALKRLATDSERHDVLIKELLETQRKQ